ncbi:MAG TPA: alpha-amylase family glycosyl hydrolase, partial [Bacteroidales bacterium]|nr:alpha-amylase family glycosyl hydrolase [Bacteroidales bacterium]
EKLEELIKVAHQHDIKVLLDFVSNHTHIEHPYFQNHRDWYGQLDLPDGRKNIRLFDEYRLTTWFDEFLPSFDFNNDLAVETITDDAIWWMEQTGADGFRHDATKHVPFKVWRNITHDLKTQIEPQRNLKCYQIGETFGSAELIKSYVNNGMLDSQFNFELFFTQRRVFAEEASDLRDLQMSLDKSLEVYGYNHLMGNIFDSHDQPRMMAFLEGDLSLSDDAFERAWREPKIQVDKQSTYEKQKTLLTFILTVPGVPIIYYGDEFGMTGAHDPDNRRMMRFGNDLTDTEQAHLEWTAKLINLRKKPSALRRGDYLPLYCDENVMIFSRGNPNQRLIIAINKSP